MDEVGVLRRVTIEQADSTVEEGRWCLIWVAVPLLAIVLLLGACSSSDDPLSSRSPATAETAELPPTPDSNSPEARADAYAKELSGGETLGCSSAAPGAESENNPGCIYSAAFTGCYEGVTGDRLGRAIEKEFPEEPALWAIYHQAVDDCRSG